ncbi:DHA2 family efflux MFS transporter permease subunit [Methanoregula sp. UBA64]|jgi:EmrB/QacA subfamily drug resistance transporter|uniref:DHA2 family efflux MFS transporter permease subunit n=1 Tax=Methanoregula sp. UBA64 TaxID=1915554 RepID=UPI0025D23A66|nr:DHA2 family efflux MFS transporter permease subunit [Methanoregula sp. UBA64]
MTAPQAPARMSAKDLLIVIVVALGSFMAGLDATIVNIALPDIAKFFEVSTVAVSWVLNAYLIILVSLLLAASRLGDMRGYRGVFLGGFALFTAGSLLCGLSPTLMVLIVSRMIQAIGGAAIAALGAVMVTSYLSASLRGQALGIVAMFTMLGAALGPVVGGFLTSTFSWQYIFFVNLPVGIAAILLGLKVIPRHDAVAPSARMDTGGIVAVFIALGALIYGLTTLQGTDPLKGVAALVVSALSWCLFVVMERRSKEPLVNLSLFAGRGYAVQNTCILLIQMAMAGVMVIMPFYLEIVKRIPTDTAGTILLALPVGMIITAPISGKISDVIGTKRPILLGFALCTAALFFLSTLSDRTSVGHVCIYLFLLGAGTGIAFSPLNSAVMGECPAKDRGSTSGLVKVMTNLGSSLGVACVMLVATIAAGPKLAEYSAHALAPAELASAFDAAFFFCMVLEAIGIVLMFAVHARAPPLDDDGALLAI